LLVGVEIRREMTVGALAERGAAILPAVAALGVDAVDWIMRPGSRPGRTTSRTGSRSART